MDIHAQSSRMLKDWGPSLRLVDAVRAGYGPPPELVAQAQQILGSQPASSLPLPHLLSALGRFNWYVARWGNLWWSGCMGSMARLSADRWEFRTLLRAYMYWDRKFLWLSAQNWSAFVAAPLVEGPLVAYGGAGVLRVLLGGRLLATVDDVSGVVTDDQDRPWGRWEERGPAVTVGPFANAATSRLWLGGHQVCHMVNEIRLPIEAGRLGGLFKPLGIRDQPRFAHLDVRSAEEAAVALALHLMMASRVQGRTNHRSDSLLSEF